MTTFEETVTTVTRKVMFDVHYAKPVKMPYSKIVIVPTRAIARAVDGRVGHVNISGPAIRKDGTPGAIHDIDLWRPYSTDPNWVTTLVGDVETKYAGDRP